MNNYRNWTLDAAYKIAARGYPTTVIHSANLDLEDTSIEIPGTNLAVQCCLFGDFAVTRREADGSRFWDCPTIKDVIARLDELTMGGPK